MLPTDVVNEIKDFSYAQFGKYTLAFIIGGAAVFLFYSFKLYIRRKIRKADLRSYYMDLVRDVSLKCHEMSSTQLRKRMHEHELFLKSIKESVEDNPISYRKLLKLCKKYYFSLLSADNSYKNISEARLYNKLKAECFMLSGIIDTVSENNDKKLTDRQIELIKSALKKSDEANNLLSTDIHLYSNAQILDLISNLMCYRINLNYLQLFE